MTNGTFKPENIPNELADLSKISKHQIINVIGQEPFKEALKAVLLGENIRDFTEGRTRTRLNKAYVQTIKLYIDLVSQGLSADEIITTAAKTAKTQFETKPKTFSDNKTRVLRWLYGMNGKLSQNALRDDVGDATSSYLEEYKRINEDLAEELGDITTTISCVGEDEAKYQVEFSAEHFLALMNTIGAATLTIRGSEKSVHGKAFEKLILGSLFQIMGFSLVTAGSDIKDSPSFWLSSQDKGERESDATLIYKDKGVRVDIGFIGRGNTEISLDKVSRYSRKMEVDGGTVDMSTFIIVDRVGSRSNIEQQAEAIEGKIFKMSSPTWVTDVANNLRSIFGEDIISFPTGMSHEQTETYIHDKLEQVDLERLLK